MVFSMTAGIERLSLSALLTALTSKLYVVRGWSPTAVNILSLSLVPLIITVMLSPTILDPVAVIVTL